MEGGRRLQLVRPPRVKYRRAEAGYVVGVLVSARTRGRRGRQVPGGGGQAPHSAGPSLQGPCRPVGAHPALAVNSGRGVLGAPLGSARCGPGTWGDPRVPLSPRCRV